MNDQVVTTLIIAFFASLAPTLAAVAALVAARRNGAKTEEVSVKADQIHEVTNGNLSAVKAELAEAQRDNAELRSELRLQPREHRVPATLSAHVAADLLLARVTSIESQLRTIQERAHAAGAE